MENVDPMMNSRPVSRVTTTLVWVTKKTVINDNASSGTCRLWDIIITIVQATMVRKTWFRRPGYGRKETHKSLTAGDAVSIVKSR